MGTSLEDVALSGVADVLSWRHTLEIFDYEAHPDHKLLTRRVIVYPMFLDKLDMVLATGNIGRDSQDSRWSAYERILEQSFARDSVCRPIMLPEGDARLSQCHALAAKSEEWMEDTKRVAAAGS
jgi:hypothetical protein